MAWVTLSSLSYPPEGRRCLAPRQDKALLSLGHDYDKLEYNGYGKEITTVDYDPHAGADGISAGNGTGA